MDWKKYLAVFGAAAFLFGAADAYARGVLYEDPETGQLFTRPGEGRVAVDAEEILNAGMDKDDAAEAAAVDEDGVVDKVMSKLPSWVRKMKLKGDLRLRYDFMGTDGKENRHRGRYRARLSLDFPVTERFSTHFMLASGGDDPKSANQSFGNSFEAPDLRLRKAYAQFDAFDWMYVRGGQMDNVLWRPSDAVWDKDINPTGVGVAMHFKNDTMAEPFMNAALYVIDETSSSPKDPWMVVVQPGVKLKLTDSVSMQLAGSYYGYQDVQGSALDHSPGSNTTSGGVLANDYDSVVASAQLEVKTPVSFVPYAGLFGEYAYNFDPDVLNDGYLAGVKFGHKKVKKGDWQASYSWRRMGKDAVLDILPDSDAFSGKTNVTGHEVVFKYGLLEHVEFGLDYYRMREITTNVDEDRFQMDFVYSF